MRIFASIALCLTLTFVFAACKNSTKPSGAHQTGMDFDDDTCAQLKLDLEKSIDQTISELRAQGMDSAHIPSRSELKKQFDGPLKANGCSSY